MRIGDSRAGIRLLLVFLTNICYSLQVHSNPCDEAKPFPERLFGSRNEKCPSQKEPVCDSTLPAHWYKVSDGLLLTHCPSVGDCGVASQAWLNVRKLPELTQADVPMNVCIRQGQDCCAQTVAVKIKNCNNIFYAYHLPPLPYISQTPNNCSSAYCIESTQSCEAPAAPGDTNTLAIALPVTMGVTMVFSAGIAVVLRKKCCKVQIAPDGNTEVGNRHTARESGTARSASPEPAISTSQDLSLAAREPNASPNSSPEPGVSKNPFHNLSEQVVSRYISSRTYIASHGSRNEYSEQTTWNANIDMLEFNIPSVSSRSPPPPYSEHPY